jgi:hypothetical protein
MLIGGLGMPAVMAPASAAALSGVSVDRAGVGSAVLNTSRQLGGSIGVALMGAIMAHEVGGRQTPQAFVHGLSAALEVAAVIRSPARPSPQRLSARTSSTPRRSPTRALGRLRDRPRSGPPVTASDARASLRRPHRPFRAISVLRIWIPTRQE